MSADYDTVRAFILRFVHARFGREPHHLQNGYPETFADVLRDFQRQPQQVRLFTHAILGGLLDAIETAIEPPPLRSIPPPPPANDEAAPPTDDEAAP